MKRPLWRSVRRAPGMPRIATRGGFRMRRILGIVFAVMLIVVTMGNAALAGGGPKTELKNLNDSVPTISVTEGGSAIGSAPAPGDMNIMGCVNSQTGIGRNPLSYWSWSDVALISACGHITVKTYDIGPYKVVVRVLNAANNEEITPRVVWDNTQNGWTYTWTVAQGNYKVQASAYECCSDTYATFDVWTD